jgi:vacuolar-type H+-ATPase subunit E/Vma4
MTQFTGILQRQVQRLEDALRHRQEARCRDIVLGAERKAKQAIRDSRKRLADRQHQAVSEERHRRANELLIARSRIETLKRRRAFTQHEKVLEESWPRLLAALEERWSDADRRRAWCDMIVTEAAASLLASDWVVEHPVDLSKEDRDAITDRVQQLGREPATFVTCDDITSGLRIRAATACVDGTTAGLLRTRHDIEALLLAAWEQQVEAGHG